MALVGTGTVSILASCREQVEALAGADVERIVCVVPHNANSKKKLKLPLSRKPRHVLA